VDKEFLTISEVSGYLNVKPSTLYTWVKSGEIPHYKLHKMVRFKKGDIDAWMENHKEDKVGQNNKVREILRAAKRSNKDVDQLVKKTIARVKGNRYTSHCGRPDQVKDLRKEVEDGAL